MAQCPWGPGIDELLAPLAAGDLNAADGARRRRVRRTLRSALSLALARRQRPGAVPRAVPAAAGRGARCDLPCAIGDYTDFYTGIHHATTVGKLFRPDNPLLPNYKWVPIGYHGRASSIGISAAGLRAPERPVAAAGADRAAIRPLPAAGLRAGAGRLRRRRQRPGPADGAWTQAEDDWFGIVLLNDWSARDIQAWEYQPLGPVPGQELRHHHLAVDRHARGAGALPCALHAAGRRPAAAALPGLARQPRAAARSTSRCRCCCRPKPCASKGCRRSELSHSNFRDAYWSVAQMLAHHSSGGCNLSTGDLLGTGTQSGPQPGQGGSMLELSMGGKQPLALPGGETAQLPAGRRHGDPARPLRSCRRAAHRLRRVPRHGAAGGVGLSL